MRRESVYKALCIHWDHHPEDESQHYGAGTDIQQIRRYLRTVKPDVTQYHTIGCYGYASYPSVIAPVVPGLVGDPLHTWKQACADESIPFGCYAASFDCRSPSPVPQWRCVNRAGEISPTCYCSNGPWTEQFFIPLLTEIMDRYHPVHFWLDGVWLPPNRDDYCYCDYCNDKFQELYGRSLPFAPTLDDWIDLQEFYEQSLDSAISRIGRAIKQRDPAILLACNTLCFLKDARKPIAEVDWLSWDALNTPNLHRASFESTYISTAGRPADIMIYDQGIVRWQPERLRRPRTLTQLKVEAGTILAHGNRVNLWHDPNPDGSIPETKAEVAQTVADFVRQREAWCIGNQSASEVAVLVSRNEHLIDPDHQDKSVRAAHQLLQESHIPCDVVHDELLLARLQQYQLVILPEVKLLNVDTAQWLHQYVTDGGRLLWIIPDTFDDRTHWMDVLVGEANTPKPTPVSGGFALYGGRSVQLGHRRFLVAGNGHCLIPYEDGRTPWLVEVIIGEGNVLMITGAALGEYAETHWPDLRKLIAHAAQYALGQLPLVELDAYPGIEVVVNRSVNDLYVHLVNLTPASSFGAPNEVFFDQVCNYHDIAITVRPPHPPAAIQLLPIGQNLMGEGVSRECQDPSGHCTLHIVVPELVDHVAIQLAGAMCS